MVLGLNSGRRSAEELAAHAIWVYALYNTHDLLRHHPAQDDEQVYDITKQFTKEAVAGHQEASTLLHNRWNHQFRLCLQRQGNDNNEMADMEVDLIFFA